MRAAWMVRLRQMEGRFAFWLTLIGYNKRDKSLSHRIYLGYALVFMCFWVFAVFTLLAGSGAGLLKLLNPADPRAPAEWLAFLAISIWGVISLVRYTRRTPFVFSEDDAYLICQTPIDRRAVALAWFPADWLESALPFWAVMVTLGFSLAEIGLHGQATVLDIPAYVLMGLRALILFIPLQMGLLAALWAIGAVRLQRDRDPSWLRWAALVAAIVLVSALVLNLAAHGLSGSLDFIWKVIFSPFYFSLTAAFGQAHWAPGLAISLAWGLLGLAALWYASKDLNLSRAAQEGRGQAAQQQAMRFGDYDKAQAIAQQARLGMGHAPSPLKAQTGDKSLVWKDAVQSLRTFHVTTLFPWIYVLSAALGIALLPGWAPRALATIIWCIAGGQAATLRLRRDLARWSLLRQLPFAASRLLLADLAAPWLLCLLVTWLGLLPAAILNPGLGLLFMVLALPVTASVTLLAAQDILRQSHVSTLMAGAAGELSARGALFAFLSAVLPLGMAYWLSGQGLPLVMGVLTGILLSAAVAFAAWQVASGSLRDIE
jgi:hypothetical protein